MPLQILPSIDLRAGQVVRLKQGDYSQQLNYAVDPIDTAKSFEAAGAKWLHIVDLDGAKEGHPVQTGLISKIISSTKLQVEAGGGIRSTADIEKLLSAGAHRVVVGTKALEDWHWFEATVNVPAFKNRLVLALDAKDGIVATKGWTESSNKRATDIAAWVSSWSIAAILYTDVAKDGMLQGPNVEQTSTLARATKVPVIASGGVGTLNHIRAVKNSPAWGVIIGRSLYEGAIDLKDALAIANS